MQDIGQLKMTFIVGMPLLTGECSTSTTKNGSSSFVQQA